MNRIFELGTLFRIHALIRRLSPSREPCAGIKCVNQANLAGSPIDGLTQPIQVLTAPEEQRVTNG